MKTTHGYTVLGSNDSGDVYAVGAGYAGTSHPAGLTRVEAWECVQRAQAQGFVVRVLRNGVQVWNSIANIGAMI